MTKYEISPLYEQALETAYKMGYVDGMDGKNAEKGWLEIRKIIIDVLGARVNSQVDEARAAVNELLNRHEKTK